MYHFFRRLSTIVVVLLFPAMAMALPPWKPKFKEMFVDDGPQSLQTAFADSVIGSCKVCHINERSKAVRNPFGVALDQRIEGNANERLKEAAKQGPQAKSAMQAELDKEFVAALDKVLKQPSPNGGGTYGQRIKAGKLPYVPAAPNTLLPLEKEQGFRLLFNGKDLDGWKAQVDDHFRVSDGNLIADGAKGRSMLYYVGPDGTPGFDDFELRLQVRTDAGANSGIYFRTKWQDAGYPDDFGYEAQVANKHKNPQKTGSIFRIVKISEPPTKDEEWFDYSIIARGRQVTLKLNGLVVTKFTEPEDVSQRKPVGELIGLQCHDPGTVQFRTIRIKTF